MRKKAIIVSGYFNPLHKGHIEYFKFAKERGDLLFIIVNNDLQRKIKGSKEFMDETERVEIISNLRLVDKVYLSIDQDASVSKTIEKIYLENKNTFKLFFANGGDQSNNAIPEKDLCLKLGIDLIDNLGEKIQSSSWLLNKK
jgi:cytidyltransferase-like protein